MYFHRNLVLLIPVAALLLAPPGSQAQQGSQGQSTSSNTSSSAQHVKKPSSVRDSRLDAGSVSNGLYRNPTFGFTCKIPLAWVLRTEEMNARESDDAKIGGKKAAVDSTAGRVLLAAFSRPPEAKAEDVNASILIAAESVLAYPGLKDAAQYFGPVTEIAKAQGFEVVNEPYESVVGTKTMVRGDFQRDIATRVMRQSTLVMLARGYAVSFTFIGGTDDDVEELVQGLSFGVGAKPAR
jgi:hypothetical protein